MYSNLCNKMLSWKLVTQALEKTSLHLETVWQNPLRGAKTGIQKSLLIQADALRSCWSIYSLCAVTLAAFLYHFMKTVDKLPKLIRSLTVKTFPGEVEGKKENVAIAAFYADILWRSPAPKSTNIGRYFIPGQQPNLDVWPRHGVAQVLSRHFRA